MAAAVHLRPRSIQEQPGRICAVTRARDAAGARRTMRPPLTRRLERDGPLAGRVAAARGLTRGAR
ncbi:MAG TPA: hypothetical protein VLA62_05995, partial [Solirubrobacterales bacterium]|nr:hypothetical protein [Solirubrobacterales bacterium]